MAIYRDVLLADACIDADATVSIRHQMLWRQSWKRNITYGAVHNNANRWQHRQKQHTSQIKTNMEGNSEKLVELLHVKCFGHSLNLAAQRALKTPTVSRQRGRTRSIMAFCRKSTIASHALNEKQKLLNIPEHKLMTDVGTRWNIACEMLERFLKQQHYSPLRCGRMLRSCGP